VDHCVSVVDLVVDLVQVMFGIGFETAASVGAAGDDEGLDGQKDDEEESTG
jgi:hypothetical protein